MMQSISALIVRANAATYGFSRVVIVSSLAQIGARSHFTAVTATITLGIQAVLSVERQYRIPRGIE